MEYSHRNVESTETAHLHRPVVVVSDVGDGHSASPRNEGGARDHRAPPWGVWEESDAQPGTITLSMTWITPFDVSTFVAITSASLMNTFPSSTRIETGSPWTVWADSSSTT